MDGLRCRSGYPDKMEEKLMKKGLLIFMVLAFLMAGIFGCRSRGNTDGSTNIILGDEITVEGDGASVTDNIVTISSVGTYNISGTLKDGMVKVDAEDEKVNLILAGADISNSGGPAILISEAAEAIVTLKEDTSNKLADGGDSDYDAALYSKPTLTINGEGALEVSGNNNEGISSEMHINIDGGNIWVKAVEDGLNANNDNVSAITISGGYLYVESEAGDGIDSNGTINISGGTVIALSSLGDASGGLDADGAVVITGGTLIATGAQISTPAESSTQKSILVRYSAAQKANTLVCIQQDGKEILTFAPAMTYQSLLYSSADIADGVSYVVYAGGSTTGQAVDGLYRNATYTAGTKVSTVTTESISDAKENDPQGAAQKASQDTAQGANQEKTQKTDQEKSQGTEQKAPQGTPPQGDPPQGPPKGEPPQGAPPQGNPSQQKQ